MSKFEFEVVLVHFGKLFWTELLLEQLSKIEEIVKINIIYKVRHEINLKLLESLEGLTLRYSNVKLIKCDLPVNKHSSFDHAESLNFAIKNIQFSTKKILVMDTDMIIRAGVFDAIQDELGNFDAELIVAVDPKSRFFSHPCFMLFDQRLIQNVDFSPYILQFQENRAQKNILIDTGRLIALEFAKNSRKVGLIHSSPRKMASLGDIYCGGKLIHLRSMTFSSSVFFRDNSRLYQLYRFESMERLAKQLSNRGTRFHRFACLLPLPFLQIFFTLFRLERKILRSTS